MALSLSGSGTPPLSWEGGSRGRRPFQTTTCLLGLMEWGWGGSSFLPELEICPSPQPPSGPHPHQQRQFQSTPAPAPPLQKKNHKRYLSSFPFAGAKGPGTTPPPNPVLWRPTSSLGDHQLVPVCVWGKGSVCQRTRLVCGCRWP